MHPVSSPYTGEKFTLFGGERLIPRDLALGTMNAFLVCVRDEFKDGHQKRDWREICEQIVKEDEPERFEQLLAELLKELDERSVRDVAGRKP